MGVSLGFDLSTQSLKCTAVGDDDEVEANYIVNFDKDLPEFATQGGVHFHPFPSGCVEVTSPPRMWIKAFDVLLTRMKDAGFDFRRVKATGVSAQQHGSVFWSRIGVDQRLGALDPRKSLFEQLGDDCFTFEASPVWMDSSTGVECQEMEAAVSRLSNGSSTVSSITGAKAYERFAGPQIRKRCKQHRDRLLRTQAISLVSSFATSLLLGKLAPIDASDAAGTNLADVAGKKWSTTCLKACAVDDETFGHLEMILKPIVDADQVLGAVSGYLVERFGFDAACAVVAGTGDNPSSLAGTRMKEGDVVVSLGTSDTIFLWLPKLNPLGDRAKVKEGVVLPNPIDRTAFMAMLVFKNGSLCREKIRDSVNQSLTEARIDANARVSLVSPVLETRIESNDPWQEFDRLLASSPTGNEGAIGIFFHEEEITPKAKGVFRFNDKDERIEHFASEAQEVRALVEGQFLAKRRHAEEIGFQFLGPTQTRILATGGASKNRHILQVLSDVMNSRVFVLENSDSASLGAAFRAKHALAAHSASPSGGSASSSSDSRVRFHDVITDGKMEIAAEPRQEAVRIYGQMSQRYRRLEDAVAEIDGLNRPNGAIN